MAENDKTNAGGGLLGGLLSAKAAQEKEEAEKAKKEHAKKERILYVFKLQTSFSGFISKKCTWKFVEYDMKLDWISNPLTRQRTRHQIDHQGVCTQCKVSSDGFDVYGEPVKMDVEILQYASTPMDKGEKKPEPVSAGSLFKKAIATEADPKSSVNFKVEFDSEQRREKDRVLTRKIKNGENDYNI